MTRLVTVGGFVEDDSALTGRDLVVASKLLTGQTAAVNPVVSFTTPNDTKVHTYRVEVILDITVHGTESIATGVTYTDESGFAITGNGEQIMVENFGTQQNVATALHGWHGSKTFLANPNTAIAVVTSGTFTGATYSIKVRILQVE